MTAEVPKSNESLLVLHLLYSLQEVYRTCFAYCDMLLFARSFVSRLQRKVATQKWKADSAPTKLCTHVK